MRVLFIGDAHGRLVGLKQVLAVHKAFSYDLAIQVGDLGAGFKGVDTRLLLEEENFCFIRGNHDSPEVCRNMPSYLGDYGMIDHPWNLDLFFMSGAMSIDAHLRTEGVSWWRDEELSHRDCERAITLYEARKPQIVVTHDCPEEVAKIVLNEPRGVLKSVTTSALQTMLDIHQPKIWLFGHYHVDMKFRHMGCEFICLNELGTYSVDFREAKDGKRTPIVR